MSNKIRTIIIDDNTIVVNNLTNHFNKNDKIEVVNSFADGESALEYIISNTDKFDLILMDILLPKLDGTALLEEITSRGIKKNVIILSSYKDDKVIKDCMNYNVTHYMLKPVNISSLENRVQEAFESNDNSIVTARKQIDVEVSELLHNLGIPSHIRGYKYLRDSIVLIYNDDKISYVTKDLYPRIAEKYDTTSSRVERAIRHAIEIGCNRGNLSLMDDLFGFSISCEKDKPTNSEFISTIADRFKLDKNFVKKL